MEQDATKGSDFHYIGGEWRPKNGDLSGTLNSLVSLPLDLVESLRDYLEELRSERYWWKYEPRKTYQNDYNQMTKDLVQMDEIIKQANVTGEPPETMREIK